jgi:hypothetical protein
MRKFLIFSTTSNMTQPKGVRYTLYTHHLLHIALWFYIIFNLDPLRSNKFAYIIVIGQLVRRAKCSKLSEYAKSRLTIYKCLFTYVLGSLHINRSCYILLCFGVNKKFLCVDDAVPWLLKEGVLKRVWNERNFTCNSSRHTQCKLCSKMHRIKRN